MKLTLIQPTDVPEPLRRGSAPTRPCSSACLPSEGFAFETVRLSDGEPLPDPARLDAMLITGSSAGVYDTHLAWMEPLRQFIRGAYAAATPMVGICFGHQIMADALGGDVRKSEKGWGLGRHVYSLVIPPARPRRRQPARIRHRLFAPGPGDRAARGGRDIPRVGLHAECRPRLSQRRGDEPPAAPRIRRRLYPGARRAAARQGAGRGHRGGPRLGRASVGQRRNGGLSRPRSSAASS